jgi:branched-chain amino acid transport system permease protein
MAIAKYLRSSIPIAVLLWLGYSAFTYPVLFASFALLGVAHGAIYALIGLGFALTYQLGRFINFSHGDVFMLGAVAAAWLCVDVFHATEFGLRGLLVVLASAGFAAIIGAGLSCASEMLVFRRLRAATSMVAVVASVGVALIWQNVGIKWNGSPPKKFAPVLPPVDLYINVQSVAVHVAWSLAFSLPAIALAMMIISKTSLGRAMRAVSDDVDAACLLGINVSRVVLAAFCLAGACAGIAGAVYAQEFHAVSYGMGMKVGLVAYASAIIGGVGRAAGAIAGGFMLGVVESVNNWVPSGLGVRWGSTVIFSVMILMLVYKPEGILGTPTVERD